MKKKIIFLWVIAVAITLSSCGEDFLETKPTSAVATPDIFLTVENALTAINGIHRTMYSQYESTQAFGGLPNLLLCFDYIADDIVEQSASNGWFANLYKWVDTKNESSAMVRYPWHIGYSTIANANMIIVNIEKASGDLSVKKEIIAQALTYRAYFYLLMVQTYGQRYDWTKKPNNQLGVPIRVLPTFDTIPRNTVEEVYAQVFSDLDEAIKLFGEANITRSSKSHLNKYTANGIKARAALATGQWQMAADAAKIARGGASRLMNASELMAGNFSVSNPEWIWGSYEQADQPLYFYSFAAYMSFNFNSSNIRGCPKCVNNVLYNSISATDKRKQWWEPNPTVQNMADLQGSLPTSYLLRPLMNRKFRAADRSSSIADFVYMRLSEMYLVEAEALARAGKVAEAQTVLTTFALSRDPQYTAAAANATDIIDEILRQRRIELWGEGFRFFDLKRTNAPLDRTNTNHLTTYCGILEVPAGDVRWQYLIPRTELNANPAIDQNPF